MDPSYTHKRPRAITGRHFEHKIPTYRWYVVYYEPCDTLDKITSASKGTWNVQVIRRAKETGKTKGYVARANPVVKPGKFDGKLEMYQEFL